MGTSVTRSEISLCTQSFLWTLLWAPSCLPGPASTPAPALGLAPCPAHACHVPAGGWATWACCCSMWPSASWCWSASSAAPRGSWSGESEGLGVGG